jgi:hypothetical protein
MVGRLFKSKGDLNKKKILELIPTLFESKGIRIVGLFLKTVTEVK